MKKRIYSDETVTVSMPPGLLLDVEKARKKIMKRRGRSFLSRSALFREALEAWLRETEKQMQT